MEVIFTKTSHEYHDLMIVREDGVREVVRNLETRSYLRHDLMHYVVEKEADLKRSFYGALSSGKGFTDMRAENGAHRTPVTLVGEGGLTELIVASLQGANKEGFSPEALLEGLPDYLKVQGFDLPTYFTRDFIDRVTKKFIYLVRRYESLKTGESLAVDF